MHLNPAAFNAHLDRIGEAFRWRKAFACPCRNAQSGAANTKCTHCNGVGQIWADPVAATAGVAGQKVQLQWQQFGQYLHGDVVLTIQESSKMYELGQFDRIVMLNSTDYFSRGLVRGQDKIYAPVASITRVFWFVDGQIVEGSIPQVAQDGTLSWTSGAPPTGMQYSVTGTAFNEYFCWGQYTTDRNFHSGARLPRKVVARKFDLFGRSG